MSDLVDFSYTFQPVMKDYLMEQGQYKQFTFIQVREFQSEVQCMFIFVSALSFNRVKVPVPQNP